MLIVNLLGKKGYFKNTEDAFNLIWQQIEKNDFDTMLNDLNCSVERAKQSFLLLKAFNTKKLVGSKVFFKNNLGTSTANYFMNFRFKLNVNKKKSIESNFQKREDIYKIFKAILRLNRRINRIVLRDFFTVGAFSNMSQKLGNFMPAVAKTIYEEYCPVRGNILDMSAGFGGRLVGAMSSKNDYSYTGVDPSVLAIEGLNRLIGFLNIENRARVICLPFEDSEGELDPEYDFCFTSPPYFAKEIYSNEPT